MHSAVQCSAVQCCVNHHASDRYSPNLTPHTHFLFFLTHFLSFSHTYTHTCPENNRIDERIEQLISEFIFNGKSLSVGKQNISGGYNLNQFRAVSFLSGKSKVGRRVCVSVSVGVSVCVCVQVLVLT
jgi:hypothetical protein